MNICENLKGYFFCRNEMWKKVGNEKYCEIFFKSSEKCLKRFYNQSFKEINSDINKMQHQKCQLSLEKFMNLKESNYFPFSSKVWKNRFIIGLTHLIYQLKCKIEPFRGKSYFGYTDDLNRRIEEHIVEALAPHGKGEFFNHVTITKLHKAIRKAFKIDKKYNSLLLKGYNFEDIYNYLIQIKSTKKYNIEMYYIRREVINKSFDISNLEMTRGGRIARDRERIYTSNYKNKNGTIGSVNHGLNERKGGGGRGLSSIYYNFPWLDISGMLSLGFSYASITEIIKNQYNELNFISEREVNRQINNLWGGQKEVYFKFLLPVIEGLLRYDINIKKKDILDLLNWSNNKFDRYFGSILYLRKLIKENERLDKNKIKENMKKRKLIEKSLGNSTLRLKNLMRGISIEKYKNWIIEGKTGKFIGEKLGVTPNMVYYIYRKISFLLVRIRNLEFTEIQKILRKNVAIECLCKGMKPRNIIGKKFNLKSYKKMTWNEVYEFYERLFEDNGSKTINYEEIMERYSQKS